MKRYRLAAPADEDLNEIWAYVAKENPAAADRLIDLLFEKFSMLTAHPQIGRVCDELAPGLHRLPAANYVIFYRIASKHIEIARVLHGARDIEAIHQDESTQ